MDRRHGSLIALASLVLVAGCSSGGDDDSVPTGQSEARAEAEAVLEQDGYLDDDEGVQFGPAGPSDDETEVHEALCTYLFGDVAEVTERAGLEEEVLADGSGYENLGGNGAGIQCGYGASSPVLALVVWGSEADWIQDGAAGFETVVELPDDGGVGVAYYDPDTDVEKLSASELEAWLLEAPAVDQSV